MVKNAVIYSKIRIIK